MSGSGRESESGREWEREWGREREKLEMKGPKSTWCGHRSRQLLRVQEASSIATSHVARVLGVSIAVGSCCGFRSGGQCVI